jgi:GTPase SAR1 family protein
MAFYPSQADSDDSFDFLFKIVLIGDAGVGKTCVVQRFKSGLQQVKQKAVGRQRNLGLRPALAELVDQWLTMRKVPLSNPILDIAFFGSYFLFIHNHLTLRK